MNSSGAFPRKLRSADLEGLPAGGRRRPRRLVGVEERLGLADQAAHQRAGAEEGRRRRDDLLRKPPFG